MSWSPVSPSALRTWIRSSAPWMLDWLQRVGADEQVAVLLARDPATHAALNDSHGVPWLLDQLRKAGADEQVAVLAGRAAAHAPLNDPAGVASLLDQLREVEAHEQVAALAERLPAVGRFDEFPDLVKRRERFRFGREPDGSPAESWGWDDLYCPDQQPLRSAASAARPGGGPAAYDDRIYCGGSPSVVEVRWHMKLSHVSGSSGSRTLAPGGSQGKATANSWPSIVQRSAAHCSTSTSSTAATKPAGGR